MELTGTWGSLISGLFPVNKIDRLAALDSVRSVRPYMGATSAGLGTTQGDIAQRSDDLRTALGVDGTGVTVGVLSDSFNNLGGWTAEVASGDLPGAGNPWGYTEPVNVLSDLAAGGTDEGRAILQTVHDGAPGASLAFATAGQGRAAFAQSIADLRTVGGADVIVDDVLYFAEPFFQEGIVGRAVQEAFAAGVSYFSAAGNSGNQSYESDYRAGATYTAGYFSSVVGTPNFAGGVSHDFDSGAGLDDRQGFTLASGATITLSFQWDQPFASVTGGAGATTDMDIYLLNASDQVVAASLDFNVDCDPVEVLRFTNTTGSAQSLRLLLVKYAGPDPGHLKYVNVTAGGPSMVDVEFGATGSTIYGHAATSGALTVGAAFWNSTPEFGTSPPQLQAFSSVGGTELRLDAAGDPLPEPVVTQKPDLVAPDGGNTSFFGGDSPADGDSLPNFSGTSAAAAHAAGVAALLLQAQPSAEPGYVYAALRNTAVDMTDTAGFDYQTGYGLIDARAACDDLTQQLISLPESTSVDAVALLDAATFGGQETFQRLGYAATGLSDEYLAVDVSRTYSLSGWARSGDDLGGQFNPSNRQYFGFATYDVDQLFIEPQHVFKFAGATDTYLAAALQPGDTQFMLQDATGWGNAGYAYQRTLAWYGYTNSTGYTYPDYTYTRNVCYDAQNGCWDVGAIDYATNTITLRAPWSGPAIPAGTAVRNATSGAWYNYAGLSYGTVPNTWTRYQTTISGVGTAENEFRPGTAYVRMLMLPNYRYSDGNMLTWRDVEWTYAASEPFQANDAVELHTNRLEFPGTLMYQWSQLTGPPVEIVNASSATASITLPSPKLVDYDLTFRVTVNDGATSLADNVTLTVPATEDYASQVDARALLDATTFSGAETFSWLVANGTHVADELIPVETSKTYSLSGWARSGDDSGGQYNPANLQHFGFIPYDVDQLFIDSYHVGKYAGSTDTTLAQPLQPGQTEVYLTNAAGWNNGSNGYARALAWYGYTDSTGYTYPDYTYTRNVLLAGSTGAWDAGAVDYGQNKITLRNPWPAEYGTLPAGTAVRNTQPGNTYVYAALLMGSVPTTWTQYAATISGEGPNLNQFRPGTAYVKPVVLTNRHGQSDNLVTWRDVEWSYAGSTPFQTGDAVDLHTNVIDFLGALTYQWRQIAGQSVEILDNTSPTARFSVPEAFSSALAFEVQASDGDFTLTDTVTLGIEHDTPDVRFRLEAVDKSGAPITSTRVGEQFVLNVYVKDTRPNAKGVFSAYLDILFDQQLVSLPTGLEFGSLYSYVVSGDLSTPGLIDEAGATSASSDTRGSPERLLFSAVVAAEAIGTVTFQADLADELPGHDVSVYNWDQPVSADRIDYGMVAVPIKDGAPPFITLGRCGNLQVTTNPSTIYEGGYWFGGGDPTKLGHSSVTVFLESAQSSCSVDLVITGEGYSVYDTSQALTNSGGTVTLGPSNSSFGFEIVAGDDEDAHNEIVSIEATATEDSSGDPPETATKTITIVDDDAPPECAVSIVATPSQLTERQSPSTSTVSISKVGACSGPLTVSWEGIGNGAEEGADADKDFTVYRAGQLETNHGFSTYDASVTLELHLSDDSIRENDSWVEFTATADSALDTENVVIIDDECSLRIVGRSSLEEADPITVKEATYNIQTEGLNCPAAVTVSWTRDASNRLDDDDFSVYYVAPNGNPLPLLSTGASVTLLEDADEIGLRLLPDDEYENQEGALTFTASDGTHSATKSVRILDDDTPPTYHIAAVDAEAKEAVDGPYYCPVEAVPGLGVTAMPPGIVGGFSR